MATATESLTVVFTDEAHEEACQFRNLGCPRVAVWRATFINVPCGHDRLYCQPHKEQVVEWDEGDDHWWECGACGALGAPGIRWSRP